MNIKLANECWNVTDGVYTVCETADERQFSFYRNDGRNVFTGVDVRETAVSLYEVLVTRKKRDIKELRFKVISEGERILLKEVS